MKLSKRSFLFFILIIGMIFSGCEKKKTEEIKPVPVVKSASQKYQEKLNEVKQLRQKLVTKKELTAEKEKFFQGKVQEIKQEILEYSGQQFETYAVAVANQQVKNRLMNIQKYDAYIKKVSELDAQITIGIDDLLTVERQFEADYQMLSLTEEIKIDDLIKQVDTVIKKHLPYANDLVLDIKPDEDLETIWNQIKAEKEEKEKAEKKEKLRLKQEEKARIKKEQLEKLRLEREEKARIEKEQLEKLRLEEEEKAQAEQAKIQLNQEISEEIKNGFFTRISQLTELTPDDAKILAEKYNGDMRMHLNNLESLSPETAQALANWNGEYLLLGLKSLSPETAQAFTNWGNEGFGGNLCFNNLESLSSETAQALVNCIKISYLDLSGLKTISRDALKALSSWNGYRLSLEGIEELPVEVAVFMAKEGRKYERLEISDSLKNRLISYGITYSYSY